MTRVTGLLWLNGADQEYEGLYDSSLAQYNTYEGLIRVFTWITA